MFYQSGRTNSSKRNVQTQRQPTSKKAAPGFAPIAIGLALGAIHIMAIPVSNASVNPARSLATAIYGGSSALSQVWVFWLAPIVGGVIGGLTARWLHNE